MEVAVKVPCRWYIFQIRPSIFQQDKTKCTARICQHHSFVAEFLGYQTGLSAAETFH